MKFRHLINEKFSKGIDIAGKYIEIFTNPNNKEIKTVVYAGGFGEIRIGVTDKPNPDIYIWDANVLHDTMKNHLKFALGLSYDYNKKSIITFDSLLDLKKYKNKKQLINKLKQTFPNIKTANIFTGISFKKVKLNDIESDKQ